MGAHPGTDVDVCEAGRDDQAVAADEGFACLADAALAVGREGDVGCAGVAAVERPFGFAVADYEDSGGRHCCGVGAGEGEGWDGMGWGKEREMNGGRR